MILWRTMDYLWIVVCFGVIVGVSGDIYGDECDWTGSGLSAIPHTVTPVYLRCPTGHITWLYPRGAIRILLRLPSSRDFRACIKVTHAGPLPSPRLFLEGPRSLLPLYSYEDGGKNNVRCFMSKGGQAAIYVETTSEGLEKRVMEIEYDLEVIPRGKGFDPTEECRPCTGEEMAHAFCTSDLVTRGIITAVENDYVKDISKLKIKITKLIRHATEDGYTDDDSTEISNEISDLQHQSDEVVLQVARHCGVNHGEGEFIFMGRRKLGDLTLRCAPRLKDWKILVKSLTEEGKTHCVLRS